ncbi:MAG: hypothetical protein LH609_05750 [Rudanella sp.]|nr:hypothetical protein [Rudanella sp.]
MRKITKVLRAAGILCLSVWCGVSCQKGREDVVSTQDLHSVSVINGLLKFASLESYEKIIADSSGLAALAKMDGFTSSALVDTKNARLAAKEAVPNATLAKVLNQDNMMQVGEWIVKLRFQQKVVMAIQEKNKGKLFSALKEDKQAEGIYKFSFNDDVLYLLADGALPSKNARPALFCCCGIDGDQTENTQYYPNEAGNTSYPMTAYNTYEAYGVYFEASTRIVYKTWPLSLMPDPPFGRFQGRYAYEQKCRNPDYQEGTPNFSYIMGPDPNNGEQFVYKYLIYASGKGLRYLLLESYYGMSFANFGPTRYYQDRR